MASSSSDLSPVAEKVLKFSIERAGDDGLRYEDYMEGLGTVLSGITISQLSIALHQLETKGFLHPDPHGTPNRKIRVTPLGRQAMGEPVKEPEPARVESSPAPSPPVSASTPAPPPPTPKVETTVPVEEAKPAPALAPEPARTSKPEPSSRGGSDTSDEIRRRLRGVIEREDAAKSLEERLRVKERELLDEEDRLAQLEKTLDSRLQSVDEKERQLVTLEDQLQEHLNSLKNHLSGMTQVNENVQKLHEKVSATRQKRQHSS